MNFLAGERGMRMAGQVTSVFMYVEDVLKSLEFYNEVVGAEVAQIHAEEEGAPIALRSFGLATLA